MLEARDLSLRILKGVSFSLRPGELVTVLGPNGGGKSTLLKLLSGEWKPESGSVQLEGIPLSSWTDKARARTIAVLPQASSTSAAFSGLDIVLMGRWPHSGIRCNREIAWDALAAVDAVHLAERIYTELSGGEQQRLQLARVLAQIWKEPESGARYLLLDEPTANLDPAQQQRTLDLARRMASEQVGVLAVMHDINLASHYSDRIVLLKDGVVVALGKPNDVLTSELIERTFSYRAGVLPHPRSGVPLIFAESSPTDD